MGKWELGVNNNTKYDGISHKNYWRNAAGSFEIRHTGRVQKSGKLYFSYFACRFTFYIVKLACRHIYDALYSNVWLKCTNSSHTFLSDEAD